MSFIKIISSSLCTEEMAKPEFPMYSKGTVTGGMAQLTGLKKSETRVRLLLLSFKIEKHR